jgi:hypothetical protein
MRAFCRIPALFLLSLLLFATGCKRKKVDEILLVKNMITRWENGVILNSLDSLKAVFYPEKKWVVKTPQEMEQFVFNSGYENIRVAGRTIRLYREGDKVTTAEVRLTLSGQKQAGLDSLENWQGTLSLMLRKHKNNWGITDYKFE